MITKMIKKFVLCAMCTIPVMVHAQEERTRQKAAAEAILAGMKCQKDFVDTITQVVEGKITPEVAEQSIVSYWRQLLKYRDNLMKSVQGATLKEGDEIEKICEKAQEDFAKIDKEVMSLKGVLLEKKYFNDNGLRGACERFFKVYEQKRSVNF